ncbi:MAG: hypothetical protein MUC85_05800 [Anaerolineales bacterium]|jgi:hypothetical protein|nr:hypothetical protein [Anaerolineales bacterium]
MSDSKETIETPPSAEKNDRPSPNAQRAIQGMDASPPAVSRSSESKEPTAERQEMLQKASLQASEHVSTHKDTPSAREVEHYKLRGRIGEELAEENMPGSVNLNDITGKSNFANYDLTSPYEMASVKVKELGNNGEPRNSDYKKYFRDLANPDSSANQRAAEDLLKIRQEEPEKWSQLADHLPGDVAQAADAKQMSQAMSKNFAIRIAGDQVAEVRGNMKEDMVSDPARYGLDSKADATALENQAQRLSRERIKPINRDFSLDDMDQAANDVQKQRPHRKE